MKESKKELTPIYENVKSYYNKAEVKSYYNKYNIITKYELLSYNTLVLTYKDSKIELNKKINKELLTSQTTLRHIKEFIKQHYYLLDNETQKTLEKNNFSKKILLKLFY